jgi:hypothetical protein
MASGRVGIHNGLSQDEPYLDGIKYDTIPPGKRFMDMTHLSGGTLLLSHTLSLASWNSPAGRLVNARVTGHADAEANCPR